MPITLNRKGNYVAPTILEFQVLAGTIICTSSNSSIDDWIDDGDIFAIEESTDF